MIKKFVKVLETDYRIIIINSLMISAEQMKIKIA